MNLSHLARNKSEKMISGFQIGNEPSPCHLLMSHRQQVVVAWLTLVSRADPTSAIHEIRPSVNCAKFKAHLRSVSEHGHYLSLKLKLTFGDVLFCESCEGTLTGVIFLSERGVNLASF